MSSEDLLYVHVTGTDQSTTLSRGAVRAAVAKGEIRQSQLIWSPPDNAWKAVREMPDLLPPPQVAPPPQPVLPAIAAPKPRAAASTPHVVAANAPRVVVKAGTPAVASTPRLSTMARAGARTGRSLIVDEPDEDSHLLRWLCLIPGILILALAASNYFLVDAPLVDALRQTPFSTAPVYAHLGAFIQPSAVVIHVPLNRTVTRDNLTEFLTALARSTPDAPFSGAPFDRIGLTTGMTSYYTFSGTAWRQLGEMEDEPLDRRKDYILNEAHDAAGVSIVAPPAKVDGKYVDQRALAWTRLADYFAKN